MVSARLSTTPIHDLGYVEGRAVIDTLDINEVRDALYWIACSASRSDFLNTAALAEAARFELRRMGLLP